MDLKAYMQVLIWMMLFVIVIEMIFPDSDYRKYLKLILGCILVYTLLQPIIKLLPQGGQSYESYVADYKQKMGLSEQQGTLDYESEMQKQQESLQGVYEEGMKSVIESELQVSVNTLDVTWDEAFNVEEIHMTVGSKTDNTITIAPIHIGDKSDTVDGDTEKLKNKIKTCLKDFYNVQDCNIYITVQKN